ncbi:MAG: hypothetical protein ACJAYJ_002747 [Saprospiraceae bacterium]
MREKNGFKAFSPSTLSSPPQKAADWVFLKDKVGLNAQFCLSNSLLIEHEARVLK